MFSILAFYSASKRTCIAITLDDMFPISQTTYHNL